MPPVVAAAAAGGLATFAGGITVTGGVIAFTATTGAIIASAAVSAALAGIGMVLTPKPKAGLSSGVTTTIRNPIAYRKTIYGERRVGGVLLFIDSRESRNKYLDMVLAVASHEIESFEELYFGDDRVWDKAGGLISTYSNHVTLEFHTGAAGDPASPHLLANNPLWSPDHKLAGIAYVVVSLKHSPTKFPAGIPNLSFRVKGKKLYDLRSGATAYSNNAALCIRDFLTDDTLGFGAAASEIDAASFIAGANLCDEAVALAAGGTEPRYTCNGVIDANTQYGSVIEALLTSMGARLTYTGGVFRLINPEYTAPTLTLDESHIRGPVQVQTRRSRRDVYNGVRGTFAAASDNFIESDYPPVISSAYSIEDGEPLYRDLPLAVTTSASMAQRLAKVELLRGRRQITAVVPVNLAAMDLVPGDTVALSLERFGWSAKPFEVESWSFALDSEGALGIDLVLVETDAAIFDWNTSEEQAHVAGVPTNLPDGFTITAPGITVTEEERTQNEDIFTVLIIDVGSSDNFAESFEVEHKQNGESEWRATGRASTTRYEVVKVADGAAYDIRARVKSVTGVLSDYTQASYTVTGSTTPPPDVTGLAAAAAGPQTTLEWTPVSDLRLSHYVVRHTPKVAGASWAAATTIVPKVARPASSVTVASRPGTYLVKAIDKVGRPSTNAAAILSPIAATEGLNVVTTITESPGFAGVKTGAEVAGASLVLAGTVPWDSLVGNWDDLVGNWDDLSKPYVSSGTYEFESVLDLGAVYVSRVFAHLQFDATGGQGAWDSIPGLWDDLEGLWDDIGVAESPALSAYLEMATTQDDPAGSPTWTAWAQLGVAEVEARGFKFRAQLASTDTDATPAITALAVTVDMPDRVVTGSAVQSGTDAGGLAIVYPGGAFNAVPAVGITPHDTVQGDFFEVLNSTVSGCTVRFKNSVGTVVDRKFDWDAKGYGRVTT